jgi:GTP cyclohydrolase I
MKNPNDEAERPMLDIFDFPHGVIVAQKLAPSVERIRRAYAELFSGYGKRAEDVLNETTRVESYSGVVVVKDIQFYTFCEHHFLPFFGSADVAYQPNSIITGLGKVVRLVKDVHARRLQIQEIMTRDIANDLMRVLDAKGTLVVTRAKHLCICSRGPQDPDTSTEVVYATGSLSSASPRDLFGVTNR